VLPGIHRLVDAFSCFLTPKAARYGGLFLFLAPFGGLFRGMGNFAKNSENFRKLL
jgi:hypothetical protein